MCFKHMLESTKTKQKHIPKKTQNTKKKHNNDDDKNPQQNSDFNQQRGRNARVREAEVALHQIFWDFKKLMRA